MTLRRLFTWLYAIVFVVCLISYFLITEYYDLSFSLVDWVLYFLFGIALFCEFQLLGRYDEWLEKRKK